MGSHVVGGVIVDKHLYLISVFKVAWVARDTHYTSCWVSVSSRWTWGVMREWSLPRISSTGKADSRKPRACISHMHWLLCTQTRTATHRRRTSHRACPQSGGGHIRRMRWNWENVKGFLLTLWISLTRTSYGQKNTDECRYVITLCTFYTMIFFFLIRWGRVSDLGHGQDVRSIGAEVVSTLPADPLQSGYAGHWQLCLHKTLEHHG